MADATLLERQRAFARHLRDPAAHPAPPGVAEHRLQVYRTLLHDNIAALLGGSFPVVRQTLGDDAWRALVRAFYAGHRCRTPLFTAIAGEFVEWLSERDAAVHGDPPWLAELAHYEWVELDLQILAPEAPSSRLSLLARPLAYAWPVHRIAPGHQPAEPPGEPTLLLARRDAQGDVRFSALSPLAYLLLQALAGSAPTQGDGAILDRLASDTGAAGDARFHAQGAAMLRRLVDEGIALPALC